MTNETKERLLEDLRSDASAIAEAVDAMTPSQLEEGRYEDGWTARQILAHVAAIEWTYPRLLKIADQPAADSGEERSARPTEGGMDGYNARQVAKRADVSAADLVAEFQKNRAATIAVIEAAEDAVLNTPIRSTGGREGTVAQVLSDVAVGHARQHLADIRGG